MIPFSMVEKDSEIKGKIRDIGFFFAHIKTKENVEVCIPSNFFLQKKRKVRKLKSQSIFLASLLPLGSQKQSLLLWHQHSKHRRPAWCLQF